MQFGKSITLIKILDEFEFQHHSLLNMHLIQFVKWHVAQSPPKLPPFGGPLGDQKFSLISHIVDGFFSDLQNRGIQDLITKKLVQYHSH